MILFCTFSNNNEVEHVLIFLMAFLFCKVPVQPFGPLLYLAVHPSLLIRV